MPKGQWTPPDAGEGAPQEIKNILAATYSNYRDEHPAEDPAVKATASQIAWGAVHNAGWEKDSKGKWIKKTRKENSSPDALHYTEGSGSQGSIGTDQHMRALAMPFSKSQMITEPDGSLLIKDFPVLVEGTWTDSAVRTPLQYTAKSLESYATNWTDNSVWNRHTGGLPRPITDKIGEVVNPHYGRFLGKDNLEHAAVMSDIRIWPYTQNQRDAQEMVRHGLIKFGSVEHGPDPEVYNPQTRMNESTSLTFRGMALVNAGACKLCRVNEEAVAPVAPAPEAPMLSKDDSLEGLQALVQSALDDKFKPSPNGGMLASSPWIVMTFPDRVIYSYDDKRYEIPYMVNDGVVTFGAETEVEEVYVEKKALELFPGADPKELMACIQKKQEKKMAPDIKELEAQIAAQESKIKELSAAIDAAKVQKPAEVRVEIPKELSELPGQMKELSAIPAVLKAISDRLDALEKNGVPRTGDSAAKELEALPEFYVPCDRKAGTIGETSRGD